MSEAQADRRADLDYINGYSQACRDWHAELAARGSITDEAVQVLHRKLEIVQARIRNAR